MDRIALILGQTLIYWRSLLLTGAAGVAILVFLALYLRREEGDALSAALAVPLSILFSLLLARYQHWYCRPALYGSFQAAMGDLSSGDFALMGAFAGCALTAALLRALKIAKSLPHMLDCMSLAGAAAIPIGRLACLYSTANRGPIVAQGGLWVSQIANSVSGASEFRLATFAIQAVVTALIFLALLGFWAGGRKRPIPQGDTALLFLLLYGSSQVVLDSTRYDALAFRSNGFVSIVQILGALAIGLAAVLFSIRLVKRRGMKPLWVILWAAIAGLLGLAGYMEYYVQRHAAEAPFAYTVMSLSLAAVIGILLFIRARGTGGPAGPFAGALRNIFGGKHRGAAVSALVVCALCLAVLAWSTFLSWYAWTGEGFVSRSATQLDMRGAQLSYEDYLMLQKELPQCRITWSIPFQGKTYPSDTRRLAAAELTGEDLQILGQFPELEELDATGCRNYSQLLVFQSQFPRCRLIYDVELEGVRYRNDAGSLNLTGGDTAALREALLLLPQVREVRFSDTLPAPEALTGLREAFPDIAFRWELSLAGLALDSSTETIDLSGKEVAYGQLAQALPYLVNLKQINLLDTPLTQEELTNLADLVPEAFLLCRLNIAGMTFRTDAQEIDISGQHVASPEAVEKMLPYFPRVQKIIMSHCGLDNETMDALNNRHKNIRFVWSITIQDRYYVRTDAEYFYPYKLKRDLKIDNDDAYVLRYCTDLIAIDIGHMGMVDNCEFVRYMPNLQYLIIGETIIHDLSPLETCKSLVYLEMFTIPVKDYTPLLGCTALEDLCLGKTYCDPAPIAQMTWLKNLWWSGVHNTYGNPASNAKAVCEATLVNTHLRFDLAHPTAGGWRQLPNYYKMRDIMGMFYMG